jgi:4-hydroxy-3-methylbut-2-en-1-yl diphosphate synthase IspG/GcpE
MYAAHAPRCTVGLFNVLEKNTRAGRKTRSAAKPRDDAVIGIVVAKPPEIRRFPVELVLGKRQHEPGRTHVEESGETKDVETGEIYRVLIGTADP